MDEHLFQFQHNPPNTVIPEFCQTGFLFNNYNHLRQQYDAGFYLLSALNRTTQQADARCAFFVRDGTALSPIAAPFGSIEFAETLADQVLDAFIYQLIEEARTAGATTLRLVNYPACYAPKQTERLAKKLHEHGFTLFDTHQTFFLPITHSSFESNFVPAERQRLRKCREATFAFSHWQMPDIAEVVNFIREMHQQKGYQLTVQPERLADLLRDFPDEYNVFVVRDGSRLAALTLTIRVRHDILYNFRPISHTGYQQFSPMVMLIAGLFRYCQQQKIHLLDLGAALDASGQPKPSLIRFKRNLGAQESPKFIFQKTL